MPVLQEDAKEESSDFFTAGSTSSEKFPAVKHMKP